MVLITAFEVPVEADEQFIETFEQAGADGVSLYRALRPDVEFRFVSVAADAGVVDVPFDAHGGLYDVVYEDGVAIGPEGTTLINPFEVPTAADDAFIAGWTRARDILAPSPGYLGTRLHRADDEADFRFVNIARWSSPLAFAKAVGRAEFQAAAAAMAFASHPALYTIVSA
jgi:heme-degrading monooxygenase HmoA